MKITIVAGARPNFIKISPIINAIKTFNHRSNKINFRLVHTGQHYDKIMSSTFFEELNIPSPDTNLECNQGNSTEQTASIMISFEKELKIYKPDIVLVVGDVNSTMACAITAKKNGIDVGHVEAGIRSNDMKMPEEINRIITDAISDIFFTTTTEASQFLKSLFNNQNIHFVGNTMIDCLVQNLHKIKKPVCLNNIPESTYFLLTLHRPSNVDDAEKLTSLLYQIKKMVVNYTIIFPVHPRTKANIHPMLLNTPGLLIIEPLGYLEFLYLIKHAKGIITDSGGITEEATYLHVPCLTLRKNTERPETIHIGTNILIGDDMQKLNDCIEIIQNNQWKKGKIPPLWDGRTSERIVDILYQKYKKKEFHEQAF